MIIKGSTPLYISVVSIVFGATPRKQNNENPKGGVKKDVCKTIAINIPTQIGSKPNENNTGPNNGIIMKIISMKSRMKPNKNIIPKVIINDK